MSVLLNYENNSEYDAALSLYLFQEITWNFMLLWIYRRSYAILAPFVACGSGFKG